MRELLDELRPYTSRNEFTNNVLLSRESYEELKELSDRKGLYVDINEELDDAVDVRITLDLDELTE